MVWTVELSEEALKALDKMDPSTARRIVTFLHDRLSTAEDPRRIGEALKGKRYSGHWKYRVGDWRLIARIEDRSITILVLTIGHRRDVYNR